MAITLDLDRRPSGGLELELESNARVRVGLSRPLSRTVGIDYRPAIQELASRPACLFLFAQHSSGRANRRPGGLDSTMGSLCARQPSVCAGLALEVSLAIDVRGKLIHLVSHPSAAEREMGRQRAAKLPGADQTSSSLWPLFLRTQSLRMTAEWRATSS